MGPARASGPAEGALCWGGRPWAAGNFSCVGKCIVFIEVLNVRLYHELKPNRLSIIGTLVKKTLSHTFKMSTCYGNNYFKKTIQLNVMFSDT